jgi:type I restriction enzyme S subunit
MSAGLTQDGASLGNSIVVLSGFPFPSAEFTTREGKPLIRIRDLVTGTTETNFRNSFDPSYLIRRGDILIGMDGDFNVVRWPGPEALLNQRVCKVSANSPEIDGQFLYWWLKPHVVAIHRRTPQTTVRHLSVGDIYGIRKPSLQSDAQQVAAAVLNTVDEAIAKTEAVIAKLKQVRAGLCHDLLTRGLDEHGQLRDSVAHPEQFQDSPLGRIPKEWRCSKFDDVLEGIDPGKSPDYPDQPAPPGEWGVLKVSAIWPEGFRPQENKWVTKAMHQIPAFQVRDGDLLISRSNTYELVGLVSIVSDAPPRLMLCDKTLRLRLKLNRGLNVFFLYLLQTWIARRQVEVNATGTSGSMKNISQDVIRALQLAYPEIKEQERILAAIAPISGEVEALGHELTKLVALKSGLMNDLLTGRVRVPEEISVTG